MLLNYKALTVRNASLEDAALLASWWNDGAVMAHAGFPNGTGETEEQIAGRILQDTDESRRLIIELAHRPIGEMNYVLRPGQDGSKNAEIGIKICDLSELEKGYGRIVLSMMIASLFDDYGCGKIILDTNLNNRRAQHVYETLGFRRLRVRKNSWRNQLGELQSAVDYELFPEDFVNFAK